MKTGTVPGSAAELLLLIGLFEGFYDPRAAAVQSDFLRRSLQDNRVGEACRRWFDSASLQACALRWRKLGHNARRVVYLRCVEAACT